MFFLQRLAAVSAVPVLVTGTVAAFFVNDLRSRLSERYETEPTIAKAGEPELKHPGVIDDVLEKRNRKGPVPQPKPAEPMPPTSCRSVEPAPKHADKFLGPHHLHERTVTAFVNASGFGARRWFIIANARGRHVPDSVIDRFELVSLLTDSEPSVYVLDEMPTAQLVPQAKHRPLDEFERLGLEAVRNGEELVWTREAPTRMFGAIRATSYCLICHEKAKEGDLLGAFTYYLTTPVDQLDAKRVRE